MLGSTYFLRCVIKRGFPFIIEKRLIVRFLGYRTVFVHIAIAADSAVESLRGLIRLLTLFTHFVNFLDNVSLGIC